MRIVCTWNRGMSTYYTRVSNGQCAGVVNETTEPPQHALRGRFARLSKLLIKHENVLGKLAGIAKLALVVRAIFGAQPVLPDELPNQILEWEAAAHQTAGRFMVARAYQNHGHIGVNDWRFAGQAEPLLDEDTALLGAAGYGRRHPVLTAGHVSAMCPVAPDDYC